MPTEHKKKKSHKEEKPSLISIKSEPDDLKPLEHYIDDRIELIRQIFSTLKSKTIHSITPEFLQDKTSEEIQEICLEELLGISTKRLKSIINATKCPADTESSDSGSDVEKVEEHISLEEISSDSNDDLSKPKRKKKRTTNAKDIVPPVDSKVAKPSEKLGENGKSEEKQYSVLELLELQARARAIRSQLALEPVTKIELDDSDDESTKGEKGTSEVAVTATTTKDGEQNAGTSSSSVSAREIFEPILNTDEPKQPSTRPLRLKRNFRQRQADGDDEEEQKQDESNNAAEKEAEKPREAEAEAEPIEKEAIKSPAPAEKEAVAVQNDDDIIPIIAEPEILCISSSDDENEEKKSSSKVKKYITMPVIEKEIREPTEDELFLLKIKEKSDAEARARNITASSSAKDSNVEKGESINKGSEDKNIVAGASGASTELQTTAESTDAKISEDQLEDGEIIEEDEVLEIDESSNESTKDKAGDEIEKQTEGKSQTVEKDDKESSKNESSEHSRSHSRSDSRSHSKSSGSGSGSEHGDSDASNDSEPKEKSLDESTESAAKEQSSKKSNIEDDDDDIIDLGKMEDLDFEMNMCDEPEKKVEQMRETRSRARAKKSKKDKKTSDIEQKDESWDKRWLRGDKVTKVLATAKLANKVRSKIKEKKSKSNEKAPEEQKPPEEEPKTAEIPPNIEVGSVEHLQFLKDLTKQK